MQKEKAGSPYQQRDPGCNSYLMHSFTVHVIIIVKKKN